MLYTVMLLDWTHEVCKVTAVSIANILQLG